MAGKSAFPPEIRKKRHAEQVYRSRMLDRRLADYFMRHDRLLYESARRRLTEQIARQRGPLPGSENG